MAQKRKTPRRKTTTTRRRPAKRGRKTQPSYTVNLVGGLVAALCLLALFKTGFIGRFVANILRVIVGDTDAVPALLGIAVGLALVVTGKWPRLPGRYIWSTSLIYLGVLLWLEVSAFMQLDQHTGFVAYTWQLVGDDFANDSVNTVLGGGTIGALMLTVTSFLVAFVGSRIVAVLLMVVGAMILFNVSVGQVMHVIEVVAAFCWAKAGWVADQLMAGIAHVKQVRANRPKPTKRPKQPAKPAAVAPNQSQTQPETTAPLTAPEDKTLPTPVAERPSEATSIPINVATKRDQATATPTKSSTDKADDEPIMISSVDEDPNYQLPDTTLLTPIPQKDQTDDYDLIEKNTQILKQTLDSFGVDAEIKHVNLGPSVTEYELHPAIGVKVSRIVNLADDLALALAAKDIRIEAPIPGKSLVGIEVPNREISTVSFREVSEAVPHGPAHLLEVPLGRDVTGQVITSDLTKMPHLLIAGSTGSGKSVAINGIITSILMNAKPNQVKLMLIDPKKVELSVYNGIPHLLTPVVSEPKKAARALHKVVHEMEQRYDLFAKVGQRKISTYNQFVQEQNQTTDKPLPTLPYIVVIVDELADLMMTVSNEVEDAIIRLAQMGRAAGIHMIIATQRPSVDVITGLIKANVPSRIAFAVSSGVDSRTILDANGAEKLLGRGDMLYQPIDKNAGIRVQGAFIPDQDVERVTNFIREQQTAEYDEQMMVTDDEVAEEQASSEDELFDDALNFVVDQQKASTSLLQRHFRIGYNRAARLIDDLEQGGFIGPQEGSKPRQVYKQKPSTDDGV